MSHNRHAGTATEDKQLTREVARRRLPATFPAQNVLPLRLVSTVVIAFATSDRRRHPKLLHRSPVRPDAHLLLCCELFVVALLLLLLLRLLLILALLPRGQPSLVAVLPLLILAVRCRVASQAAYGSLRE